jgi:hypothetical protein
MKNEEETIILAVLRAKAELGKETLDMSRDVLPYMAEHKNELQKDVEDMTRFRMKILVGEIKEKTSELHHLVQML